MQTIETGGGGEGKRGMPLGNLTSQFFANVYLNELDYFVKHVLKAKYYIRYVDDFVILHHSREQLGIWEEQISTFLKNKLKIELHPDKSRVIPLSEGISFVGFRVFYHHKLLRKFNRKNAQRRYTRLHADFIGNKIWYDEVYESMQGSFAYMKHANTYNFRMNFANRLEKDFPNQIAASEFNRYMKFFKKKKKFVNLSENKPKTL